MLKLLEDFRDVCERASVLIISGSTEYEFSAAIFNKLSKLSKFTIIMGCLRTKTDERMVFGGLWFSLLIEEKNYLRKGQLHLDISPICS